jgi:hypothetical protein
MALRGGSAMPHVGLTVVGATGIEPVTPAMSTPRKKRKTRA